MLLRLLDRVHHDEDGAVTVDWVVLTAGVIGLGLLVISTIEAGATDTATGVGVRLSEAEVPNIEF